MPLLARERVTWSASLNHPDVSITETNQPSPLHNPVNSVNSVEPVEPSKPVRPNKGPTLTTGETPAPDTLTPRGLHRSRRSVPSFLPSLQHSAPSSNRHSAAAIEDFPSTPNVAERRHQDHPSALRPDVNGIMPSSMAYSETRTLPSGHARSLNAAPRFTTESTAGRMDEARPRNDDIFLNIAKTDSSRRESLGRSDFRRSRLGYSSGSLRSPATRDQPESTPSPDHRPNNAESPLLSSQNDSAIPYNSSPYSPAASAHPLDDPNRFRYSSLTSGARSTIGAPRSRLSRTSPETSPRSPAINGEQRERRASLHESRLHRNSGLSTVRGSRQPSTSEVTERARGDMKDGTESTLSTTAPSTVWDELDDLKSRIRKLELTGKLPPSSQAAISGANTERPRTAATTMTALSTSPRHHRKVSSPSAETESAAQNPVHPLLQSALGKAKTVLSSDVFSALEATITDALALSTMLGVSTAPSGSVSVVNGGYSSSERHARRKADSVCRSLTELCLSLTDQELKRSRLSSSQGPSSSSQFQRSTNGKSDAESSLAPTPSYQRATSQEPEASELRHSTNRIPSRLEARRASFANPSPASTIESKQPQSPNLPTPPSRLHRISTSMRSRRVPAEEEAVQTPNPNSRSISRAMTEIGTPSPAQSVSPRQRLSRGHSVSRSISGVQQDQQGLGISPRSPQYAPSTPSQIPASQPRTPSTLSQTGIPFRRSYMTPGVYSPATSRSNIQAGSRRYGLSPGLSNATPNTGEENPRSSQLEPSQTRISAPSSKTVTSYTPIQQPRIRTNSLGSRRFALRRRSAVNPDETVNLDDSID